MQRLTILTLVLLLTLTLFSCGRPAEEAEVEPVIPSEEEVLDEEQVMLPDEFPVYPGAVYSHYFHTRGYEVFEYISIDTPQTLAENYMEILREKGYDVAGESSDRYLDIQVTREGLMYAHIEGEYRDMETKIRISFAPQQ